MEEQLTAILSDMYQQIDNKEIFIPVNIANALIVYKMAHDDIVYWKNFSKKSSLFHMDNLKDMYLFFVDFLPQTSQFQKSYTRKVDHMKEFHPFLEELYFSQKFYYKNPGTFRKHLERSISWIPNPRLSTFTQEIFKIVSHVRFSPDA